MKPDKKILEGIIHDVFQNYDLKNSDLYCDETYNSIVDMIYETYILVDKDPFSDIKSMNDSLFTPLTDNMKLNCKIIYSNI